MPGAYKFRLKNVTAGNCGNVHRATRNRWHSFPLDIRPGHLFSGRLSTGNPDSPSGLLQGTLDLLILQTVALGPVHGHAIAKSIDNRSRRHRKWGAVSLSRAATAHQRWPYRHLTVVNSW